MTPEVVLPPGRDLDEVRHWALGAMAAFGLEGWRFEYTRAVRVLGTCRYRLWVIGLSRHHVERNPPEEVRETLLHEICHALVGPGHGHDEVWKAECRKVGCRPERCCTAEIDMPQGRWRATCGGCGSEFRRHRRPRPVKYHCRRCGTERGQLSWTRSAS